MQSTMRTKVICAVLVSALAALWFSADRTVRDDSWINRELELAFLANLDEVMADAAALQERKATLVEFGMEPQAAGIHIVDPPAWVNMSPEEIAQSSSSTGVPLSLWNWWRIRTNYADPADGYPDFYLDSHVIASMERLIPNSLVSLSKALDGGSWRVDASLKGETVAELNRIHGPHSSRATFSDWNGVLVAPGGVASLMTAALVSNNEAFPAFDVSAIVSRDVAATVTLATGLTSGEADDLIQAFEAE